MVKLTTNIGIGEAADTVFGRAEQINCLYISFICMHPYLFMSILPAGSTETEEQSTGSTDQPEKSTFSGWGASTSIPGNQLVVP